MTTAWAPEHLPVGVVGLPLDTYDPEHPDLGDPGQLAPRADDHPAARSLTFSGVHPAALAVVPKPLPCPFVRLVQHGNHGLDVLALKRALVKAGYRPPAMANSITFGTTLEAEVKAFQRAHHLTADGEYGPATHKALTPSFDRYGRHLLALELAHHQESPHLKIIHAVVAVALFTLANPTAIGYSQGSRRMEGVTRHLHPPELPGVADCSSLVTWDYYAGGGPDPNGRHFDGLGFTGSQADHCTTVPFPGPPGAIYLYGRAYPYEHEALGLGDGSVISHGSPVTRHLAGRYRPDLAKVVMPPELLPV